MNKNPYPKSEASESNIFNFIPRSFQLLGRTYTVRVDPTVMQKSRWGEISFREGIITLYPEGSDISVNREMVENTFYHELINAILTACGREDLSSDENLVEILGGLLHQFEKTATYDFD